MIPWLVVALSCGSSEDVEPIPIPPIGDELLEQLDVAKMRDHVEVLADDSLGGRIPGSIGSQAARDYILGEMIEVGLQPLGDAGAFTYVYDNEPESGSYMFDATGAIVPHATVQGADLIGIIPGSDPDLAHEHMVVMAHYDHLGVTDEGEVFNGAFDNAAAVAMNLELARLLIDNDIAFKRSLIFLFTDDEEFGLDGSEAWIEDPTVPQESIVFGVSTDPLGRASLPDFDPIVLIGLERSPGLESVWREAASYLDDRVFFIHRDIIPIFASDQDPFFEHETPALWFTNIGFSYYHTTGDVPETIDYRIMVRNTRLLVYGLALIGSRSERYDYLGPVEPAGEAATEALRLVNALLGSSVIDDDDRDHADYYTGELEKVIEADSHDALDNMEAFYVGALYFLLFDLPTKYPGDIPPPWPGNYPQD